MEIHSGSSSIAVAIAVVAALTLFFRLGNWLWFRPKKLERFLKHQGLSGNPYRFYYGDLKDNTAAIKNLQSKPFDYFSHDVASRVIPYHSQLVNRYGKNTFMWFGPVPRVNIMNPEHIKDVFMKMHSFKKARMNPLFKFLAQGLSSLEGDEWAKHRKIITPAFHQEKLRLMFPQFYDSCNTMIENWKNMISSKDSCEIDVWPYLQNMSCDVISRSAFGSNYKEGKLIFDHLKEITELLMQTSQSVYFPGLRFLPTKMNKRMEQMDREIRASLKDIISKKEELMKRGESAKDDLLGILMESNQREMEKNGSNKNKGLSIDDVMDECRLFYFAGQETTSALMVWTMILLSKYPNWQASAREEVLQVFGEGKPKFEGLNHLKVMSMILYEVLRLYPPGVMLTRRVHEDTNFGDFVLPAGVQVAVPIVLIHNDRDIWGDDALEFKPERFSEGVSKAAKHQGAYLPFGLGPRICIGQNFALLEAKMALSLILQNFSFEFSPSYSHAPRSLITLQPQYGAPLVLRKI